MIRNKNSNGKESPDRVYYNIVMKYNPALNNNGLINATPAIFTEQLSQSIIENPSEYYMSIVRFTIPTQNIPIFIFEAQPFPNLNMDLGIYSVTLSYNGNFSPQTFVTYETTSPNVPKPLPVTASNPNWDRTPYYYVYTYSQFLKMINTALATAFAAIPLGAPVGSIAPYFIIDEINERISLVAQRAFYDITLATPILIYINYNLHHFLDGIPINFLSTNSLNGRDIQFLVRDQKDNWYNPPFLAPATPPDYFIMTQEYPTLINWNSFKSLQMISNSLPIKDEYVPTFQPGTLGALNFQSIVKDFEPLLELGPEARTSVQYQLNSPYQLINLFDTKPLNRIDIGIYWTDEFENKYVVTIPKGSLVTIKLVFIKKSTFEGY